MTQAVPFERVFELERRLEASWVNLHRALEDSKELHRRLTASTEGLTAEDSSIVVFGSVGRFEVTADSDVDWTYLIDGQANLQHQATARKVQEQIDAFGKRSPGRKVLLVPWRSAMKSFSTSAAATTPTRT
jgi:predicted nucleotidyltransferase